MARTRIDLEQLDAFKGLLAAIGDGGFIKFDATTKKFVPTTDLFWDDVNNRLGIGTVSPDSTLHIEADTAEIIIDAISAGDADPAIILKTEGGEKARVLYDKSLAQLSFYVNGGHRLVVEDGGNVGIGITTPGAELDIRAGSGLVQTTLRIGGSNSVGLGELGDIEFYEQNYANTTVARVVGHRGTSGDDGQLSFETAKDGTLVTRLLIDENGNVGIGTDTPSQKFVVQKNQNDSTLLRITNATAGTASRVGLQLTTSGSENGYVLLHSASYTGVPDWADSMVIGADSSVDGGVVLHSFDKVRIQNVAGTDVLTVAGGAVGIGTDSPNASSIFEVSSFIKGFLPPRMSTTQRDAISTPAEGLEIYNTTTKEPNFFDGADWQTAGGDGVSSSSPISADNALARWDGTGGDTIQHAGVYVDDDGDMSLGAGFAQPGAILDLNTTTKGFLMPRMTTAQRNLIAPPNVGMQIFNTTTAAVEFHDGNGWATISTPRAVVETALVFFIPSTLVVSTNSSQIDLYAPRAFTIANVHIASDTAPTGASIIVDVNLNGTSIFTTQANRPTITAGNNSGTSGTPDVTAVAKNDIITIDIDQIGSTEAGKDLVVQIRT